MSSTIVAKRRFFFLFLPLRRAARAVHHAVFNASREGRAAEIAIWSNAASALAVAGAVVALTCA